MKLFVIFTTEKQKYKTIFTCFIAFYKFYFICVPNLKGENILKFIILSFFTVVLNANNYARKSKEKYYSC